MCTGTRIPCDITKLFFKGGNILRTQGRDKIRYPDKTTHFTLLVKKRTADSRTFNSDYLTQKLSLLVPLQWDYKTWASHLFLWPWLSFSL